MSDLSTIVVRLASTLPPAQRERMAQVLSACEAPSEEVRARLSAVASAPAFAGLVSEMSSAWREAEDMSGSAIALALRAAGRAVDEDRRRAVRPVWTGPDAGQPIRLTAAVVAEVIADARQRLVVLSFAAYKIPEILRALEAAARRGVTVDVVLETAEDSDGSLSFDHLPAFAALAGVRVWHWPASMRPAEGGSLHAKALVADGDVALVTSANLTGHAMKHNIELGLLVTDHAAATAIVAHVDGLARRGVLVRVNGWNRSDSDQ